jgi:antitoxin ParD1/3/4
MSISLASDLVAQIRAKVESGLYPSESDVVREALRALEDRDRDDAAKLKQLRKDIQIGLDQIERGEVAPLDMDEIRAEVQARIDGRRSTTPTATSR